ncbi:M4 family metallopeptidase [Planococcus lenghuensis]|uniref:Neutral metalloproteinase n=1 Tax=Planococcus lenghuensis TaxID=2213202 RepID=A0A1Q2L3H5_9BACL|nr:M4 family metallopeptidase [Planococcus lenghuensis]AQQ54432.1 flagellar biosynthesis protein FlgM [Planococcus lenghuensis]
MNKKMLVSTVLSSALIASSFSATNVLADSSKAAKNWNDNANVPVFVKEKIAKKRTANNAEDAFNYLEENTEETGIKNPKGKMHVKQVQKDELGMTHIRFNQTANGVPVEGAEVIVHYSEDNEVVAVNGHHVPEAEVIDTTPEVSSVAALQRAKEAVNAPAELSAAPTSELVVYPTRNGNYLAYKVNVNFLTEEPGNWFVFVDANTGKVIDQYNAIMHTGDDHQQAVGTGVLGESYKIHTTKVKNPKEGAIFSLTDTSHEGLDGINTIDAKAWEIYTNDSASWKADELKPAVDAHYNSEQVYEYYLDEHGRNSLDGKGMAINSYVNFGNDYNNAFWTGHEMVYGNGDGSFFIPLSAGLDVAAHEMTHGVITHSANLKYKFQSGALNESFADIFGVLIDEGDWELGEDIMGPGAVADGRTSLRSLSDPAKYPVGATYAPYGDGEGNYPSHMDEYYELPEELDNGGVHINSSITNHAAYLIGEEIGKEKLGQIYYRALTVYLTATSNFSDARKAIVQSAIDLYGTESAEVTAVENGFDGVGIYE